MKTGDCLKYFVNDCSSLSGVSPQKFSLKTFFIFFTKKSSSEKTLHFLETEISYISGKEYLEP